MPTTARTILVAMICLISGCATPVTDQPTAGNDRTLEEIRFQRAARIERIVSYQQRLDRISLGLLRAAIPYCEDETRRYVGLRVDNLDEWPKKYHRLARRKLGLDDALRITSVAPDSPAADAGIQVGDRPIRINGTPTVAGPGAVDDFAGLLARSLENGNANASEITLTVVRENQNHRFHLEPSSICNYRIAVLMDNAINAYADGHSVAITSGLLRFAENDREIAMVLAHEIAHNAMDHREAKMDNAQMGSILDLFAAAYGVNTRALFTQLGARSFSSEFEREADYLGLYLMARAGMELNGLSDFWRRMAAEQPADEENGWFRSHPITAERAVAVRETVREIEAKRRRGASLRPEGS